MLYAVIIHYQKYYSQMFFFPFLSHLSGRHELFFTDATTLVKGFAGDRQFNLDSPRMILTNVSWSL